MRVLDKLSVTRVEGCTSARRGMVDSWRRNLSVAVNVLMEHLPGRMWQATIIAARSATCAFRTPYA